VDSQISASTVPTVSLPGGGVREAGVRRRWHRDGVADGVVDKQPALCAGNVADAASDWRARTIGRRRRGLVKAWAVHSRGGLDV
jgi:hypothetical protein